MTSGSLWKILTPDERRSAVGLIGLMLIGMVLETLGISLVIPALGLMTSKDFASTYPALGHWFPGAGRASHGQLVIAGMLVLVGVYAVKALFLAFLAWRQARFAFGTQANLSQRLFIGYLRQPWTFHLQRNSAQLLRNVTTEVNNFTAVLQAVMTACAEGFVVTGLALLIVAVEPVGALLVIGTVAGAAWGFHRLTRARLLRWGEGRLLHEGLRIQHLQQGLGGVKDVKLLGREDDFLAQYSRHNAANARAGERQFVLQQLPRLWLELLAMAGLAVLVIAMIARGRALEALLPTLGLFAATAFRLMPSVVRIMVAAQTLRFCLPVVGTLHQELMLLDASGHRERQRRLPFRTDLVLDRITFRYPTAHVAALQDVSLTIPCGAAVGFIGGSGAGKSTLVDVILGLLTPASGQICVDGVDIQSNLRGWQDQIGYVPQSIFLTDDTLRRNVAFGIADDEIDDAAVRSAIVAAQLDDFASSLPRGLDTTVGERGVQLSGGQRQRIGIARALYHDPPLLVLDEATSSLDTSTEQGVMDAVKALHGRKTLLIVAHRVSTVAHCDRLYRLVQGRVVEEGTVASVTRASAS
jgi:ABC-type multidrug transport system fused ATPase/permease subunit